MIFSWLNSDVSEQGYKKREWQILRRYYAGALTCWPVNHWQWSLITDQWPLMTMNFKGKILISSIIHFQASSHWSATGSSRSSTNLSSRAPSDTSQRESKLPLESRTPSILKWTAVDSCGFLERKIRFRKNLLGELYDLHYEKCWCSPLMLQLRSLWPSKK